MASNQNIGVSIGTVHVRTPINAVTATTTSGGIPIQGAKKITWFLTRADHSAGSTTWTFEVSPDGTVWEPFNKLITNATNTNAQNHVRVASLAQAGNGVDILHMDLEHGTYVEMRAIATEATDGTHTAVCVIEF